MSGLGAFMTSHNFCSDFFLPSLNRCLTSVDFYVRRLPFIMFWLHRLCLVEEANYVSHGSGFRLGKFVTERFHPSVAELVYVLGLDSYVVRNVLIAANPISLLT